MGGSSSDTNIELWQKQMEIKLKKIEDFTKSWADVERREIRRFLEKIIADFDKGTKEQKEKMYEEMSKVGKKLDIGIKMIRKDLAKKIGKKKGG